MHAPRLPAGFAPVAVHKLVRPNRLLIRRACQAGQGPQSLGPSGGGTVPAQKMSELVAACGRAAARCNRSTTFTNIPSRSTLFFRYFRRGLHPTPRIAPQVKRQKKERQKKRQHETVTKCTPRLVLVHSFSLKFSHACSDLRDAVYLPIRSFVLTAHSIKKMQSLCHEPLAQEIVVQR